MEKYLSLARGSYQRAILLGTARMSGADLRGKASSYAAHYARSRRNLLARLSRAGLPYSVTVGKHNRIELVLPV